MIREDLIAKDPRNATWQRDLGASFHRIATVLQERDPDAARIYWNRCRQILRDMSAQGMHLDPPLQALLLRLESSCEGGEVDIESAGTTSSTGRGGLVPMEQAAAFRDFLDKEGYRATINESGNVQFKKEGWIYLITPDEKDPAFFRLLFPGFKNLGSAAEKERAYIAAHEVGSTIKVAKILIDGDRVHAVFESLVPDLAALPHIFERAVNICRGAADKFTELLSSAPDGAS